MRVKIYQINPDRDINRVMHERLSNLELCQGSPSIQASIYDEVFSAEIDFTGLEQHYTQFNTTGHPLHRGGQMKVSDIVVMDEGDLKRFLALYFDAYMNSELMPDYDGEQFLEVNNREEPPAN